MNSVSKDTITINEYKMFLPEVESEWVRSDMPDSVYLSPHNSKVFAGAMQLVGLWIDGKYDNLPLDVSEELVTLWTAYQAGLDGDIRMQYAFDRNKRSKVVLSFGKPAIMSCPFAGSCMKYCYAEAVENTYAGSLAVHVHNYAVIWAQSTDIIVDRIQAALTNETRIVRLNDSGDFTSYNEVKAWYQIAVNNPQILFYGYTKATPYIYKLRSEFGPLPSNFVINVSSTDNPVSETFRNKLDEVYPNEFNVCWIVETVDMYQELSELPFNNEEEMAMMGASDFLIGLHGTFKKDTPEFAADKFFTELEHKTGIQVC
jgi:hypothetical protein